MSLYQPLTRQKANIRCFFTSAYLLLMVVFCLQSCKEPDTEIVEVPVFSTDTTGDNVSSSSIITYNIYKDQLYLYQYYPLTLPANVDPVIAKKAQLLWDQEKGKKEEHQRIYKLFADLIPERYRQEITYFSISAMDGYASIGQQKLNSLDYFNLSVIPDLLSYTDSIPIFEAPDFNHNTLGYAYPVYTMIHEFGHYITSNKKQVYMEYLPGSDEYVTNYKKGSVIDSLLTNYWRPYFADESIEKCSASHKQRLYTCLPAGEFVSAYASSNHSEDAAESFAHFVLLDGKPKGTNAAERKILLFYKNPEIVEIREAIRANMKKLGIVPREPNMRI
jgi:hypothetical protein